MESEFEKERSRRLEQLAKLPWRNECRCDGCVEQEMFDELAETRRQRDLLLEKGKAYLRGDERRLSHWNNCPRYVDLVECGNSNTPCGCGLDGFRDAIRECEPPKLTRREVLIKIVEDEIDLWVPGQNPVRLVDRILDALDGGGQ